ncbi:MAG: hypothetical protein HOP20_06440 [Sulfuriferula sp.]|nr:hypothetical protein [Sulfuriferula sp.]
MNILWIQPNGILALTSIFDDSEPAAHASLLQERGDIPADWILAATNVEWEETGWRHESHRWNGTQIFVDLDAAKVETKSRLREQRAPLLIAQDIKFMEALEKGNDIAAISAEKQRLRDITKLTDAAEITLGDLKLLSY